MFAVADGEDLIIRDTPENITKIEELLTNKKFIQDIQNEKLDIQNFSLVPKDVENIQSDQVQNFTARVDHNLSAKDQISGRYIFNDTYEAGTPIWGHDERNNLGRTQNVSVSWTRLIG